VWSQKGRRRPVLLCIYVAIQNLFGLSQQGYDRGKNGFDFSYDQWVAGQVISNGECFNSRFKGTGCRGDGDAVDGPSGMCQGCLTIHVKRPGDLSAASPRPEKRRKPTTAAAKQ